MENKQEKQPIDNQHTVEINSQPNSTHINELSKTPHKSNLPKEPIVNNENKNEKKHVSVKQTNPQSDKKNTPKSFNKKPKTSIDGFFEKVVAIKRISKTTKGGRSLRFSVLAIVGDKKGQVGFGMGKSIEIPNAMKKAVKNAKSNVFKVIMNKKGTLYHEVIGRSCAAKVLLKPAPDGTGIVAGGAIRAVIEAAGYKDVYTKNLGRNTAVNMVRATIDGLKQQKTPAYIANMRDKSLSEL